MEEIEFIRTALFVPGNQPDRIDKAVDTAADVIIIDLEDAVPHALKKEIRPGVRKKIIQHKNRKLFVRVNALDSSYIRGDLDETALEELSGLVVPKVETVEHIREIHRLLLEVEQKKGIQPGRFQIVPLIETALGIENAFQIVSERTEPERLLTAAFGAADFALDMGIEITKSGEELSYSRARLAVACRAAKIDPPLDTPFMIDLKDLHALEEDAQRARQLGFQGKLCVHPNQIDICNRIFSPTGEEIAYAEKVVEAFNQAEADGLAAIQVEDKLIDYPIVEHAKRILEVAGKKL